MSIHRCYVDSYVYVYLLFYLYFHNQRPRLVFYKYFHEFFLIYDDNDLKYLGADS